MTQSTIRLGTGIYLRSDAARLLGVAPARVRRWVDGYTYWVDQPRAGRARRRQPPIVQRDLPPIDRAVALSFVELMELRVVKAMIDHGMSLQAVRTVARIAADYFSTEHPLASRRLYTDGRKAFAAVHGDSSEIPDLVELSHSGIDQIIAGHIFQPFLAGIDFDPHTALAERWWPFGKHGPIVLDPEIAFGAPVIAGTATRTSTVARMAEETSVAEAAQAFDIEEGRAIAAVEFERQLAIA
ncbi:MAG: DUF433 domain-containing protein [Gemmatimonadaceae bacterium]